MIVMVIMIVTMIMITVVMVIMIMIIIMMLIMIMMAMVIMIMITMVIMIIIMSTIMIMIMSAFSTKKHCLCFLNIQCMLCNRQKRARFLKQRTLSGHAAAKRTIRCDSNENRRCDADVVIQIDDALRCDSTFP